MPRNRVQHQKGLSDDAFERLYPHEEACRKAWFAWRWPEGFKCPRCAWTKYSEIQGRQLLQCRRCPYQTSLIAGTVLQGTKLPGGCGSAPCVCLAKARREYPTSSWAGCSGSRPTLPGGFTTS